MSRTPLDSLVTRKSLDFLAVHHGDAILDMIEDGSLKLTGGSVELKNVCAKVPAQLAKEIDDICNLLDISKRRFLEAAFVEAVSKAHAIMSAEGVFEAGDGPGQAQEIGK